MMRLFFFFFFFFKQKTAYEMAQCDWSSDVCSSDLRPPPAARRRRVPAVGDRLGRRDWPRGPRHGGVGPRRDLERGDSTIQRAVSAAAENARASRRES